MTLQRPMNMPKDNTDHRQIIPLNEGVGKILINELNCIFTDNPPKIFGNFFYEQSNTYVCKNNHPFCHYCNHYCDDKTFCDTVGRILSANKSYSIVTKNGNCFKMMSNFYGKRVFPEIRYVPLLDKLNQIFGVMIQPKVTHSEHTYLRFEKSSTNRLSKSCCTPFTVWVIVYMMTKKPRRN